MWSDKRCLFQGVHNNNNNNIESKKRTSDFWIKQPEKLPPFRSPAHCCSLIDANSS